MMNSAESYAEMIKDFTFEQLVKERNGLIKEIHRFEKRRDNENIVYYWSNQYLIEVTELINKVSRKTKIDGIIKK